MAPESVPIDLRGVPLKGRDGHIWTRFQDGTPSGEITHTQKATLLLSLLIPSEKTVLVISQRKIYNIHGMVREGHSHLTLTVREEAECESLGHPCKVADASGVDSAGIGQGAQQVVGQIAAASL